MWSWPAWLWPPQALLGAPFRSAFSFLFIIRSGACNLYPVGVYRRMRKDIKASCQKRLSRIEGQVRGLSKMVEDDRYCIDIVTQISAVRAALRRVEEEVLRDHVSHCVGHAITSGNKADQRQKISELMDVIGRSDR